MNKLAGLKPERVFKYFEELSRIPRGSGNMEGISKYCMEFAKKHSLRAVRDEANNVIIFKNGAGGRENSEPIILQGHLDMVCQKEENCDIDFERDGLKLYIDGDYVKAEGTTLGADNGIAVAMIFAILESDTIVHPPIEAVFTTDEEIGMIGAGKLSVDGLKGRKMINLDAEEPGTLTVSCAGGSDFRMTLPIEREKAYGKKVTLCLRGLNGGHSGIEINSGRVNANILAGRVLNFAKNISDFGIISIDGGDKGNAIPNSCTMQMLVENAEDFVDGLERYLEIVKKEIADREKGFEFSVSVSNEGEFDIINSMLRDKLMFLLICAPNGVVEMSAEIDNLVESSLNLGILKTDNDMIVAHFTLRSNKKSALAFLEEKLSALADYVGFKAERFGHYPPWEYKENSKLQAIYKNAFAEEFGYEPEVVAIHAGLECGIFSSAIEGLDCIAIGPKLLDVHTVNERLCISSTQQMFELLLTVLEKLG